jgi:ABC-2 type transport system permease protein
MAVYRRGYLRYQGPLTDRASRLLVLPKFAWQGLMQQRLIVIILVASVFWPLGSIAFVYLANHLDVIPGLRPSELSFLRINAEFFVVFMNVQGAFAIILSAFAGPSLIAPDLANGALPLYFSRPLSRAEYVLARILVLVGILSPVTWIPGLLLFGMQAGMAGGTWFRENWKLGVGVLVGLLVWILFVGLVAMTSSAYVKWRIVAGALVMGVFFVLAGVAEMTNAVLRVEWALVFDPARAMNQIWRWMLGADAIPGPAALPCAIAVAAMAGLLVWVLERKLKPVEVVS